MNMNTIKIYAITLTLVLFSATQASATPVFLSLTIDQPTTGRAVLSGNLTETIILDLTATSWNFTQAGTNWHVQAEIIARSVTVNNQNIVDFNVVVRAQHLTGPHAGEVAPALELATSHNSIQGRNPFFPANQTSFANLIHPGSGDHHKDFLTSQFDDLNGTGDGFLSANNQLSLRIDMTHGVPEPASMALLGSGLLGMIGLRRKR